MSLFAAPADAYDAFMGRYAVLLAPLFLEFAEVEPGSRVLDVGAGPGALTAQLAAQFGADRVAAAEPTPGFAAACAARVPGADVREAPAEALPFDDGSFDACLAQLVLPFMNDAAAGVGEMSRVTRDGGVVATCVWDMAGGMLMLRHYWRAALKLFPGVPGEGDRARFGRPETLQELWAGLADVSVEPLDVEATYADFEDYWRPFQAGIGPAGAHLVTLDAGQQEQLRAAVHANLGSPTGGFSLAARAWAVRGRT